MAQAGLGRGPPHRGIVLWCQQIGIGLNFSEWCSETKVSQLRMWREGCCVLGEIVLHSSFSQMLNSHTMYILFSLITVSIHLELP